MRLQLDAEPEELCCKAHDVLEHLASHAERHDPEIADHLRKAIPAPRVQSEHRALVELQGQLRDAYAASMQQVMSQVVDLLEAQHEL